MNFPDKAPVTAKKLDELRARIDRLDIDLGDVDEQFVRSPGPGGQKVNKTASTVVLRCPKHGVVVKWSRERSRALNRFLALRELVDEIEVKISPETSKRLREQERIRARKRKKKRRAKKKHGGGGE